MKTFIIIGVGAIALILIAYIISILFLIREDIREMEEWRRNNKT